MRYNWLELKCVKQEDVITEKIEEIISEEMKQSSEFFVETIYNYNALGKEMISEQLWQLCYPNEIDRFSSLLLAKAYIETLTLTETTHQIMTRVTYIKAILKNHFEVVEYINHWLNKQTDFHQFAMEIFSCQDEQLRKVWIDNFIQLSYQRQLEIVIQLFNMPIDLIEKVLNDLLQKMEASHYIKWTVIEFLKRYSDKKSVIVVSTMGEESIDLTAYVPLEQNHLYQEALNKIEMLCEKTNPHLMQDYKKMFIIVVRVGYLFEKKIDEQFDVIVEGLLKSSAFPYFPKEIMQWMLVLCN